MSRLSPKLAAAGSQLTRPSGTAARQHAIQVAPGTGIFIARESDSQAELDKQRAVASIQSFIPNFDYRPQNCNRCAPTGNGTPAASSIVPTWTNRPSCAAASYVLVFAPFGLPRFPRPAVTGCADAGRPPLRRKAASVPAWSSFPAAGCA